MIANLPFIENKFEEFNTLVFGGKLPKPPIKLSKAKTYLGQCAFKRSRSWFGKTKCEDFLLRFSTRYDLSASEIEDIILHEMIHYYIGVFQLKDTSAHGKIFRQMMADINHAYGRHITISHKSSSLKLITESTTRNHHS